jgi:HEAT repeat protein
MLMYSVRTLLLGIVVITWLYAPDNVIGSETSDKTVVPQVPSLQELIGTLNKGNPYDRQRAAVALGNTKDSQAVEPLIKSLKDDDDFVRNFSARSLGSIGDPRALDPLIQALEDKHFLVKCSAAQALGILKDARAVDPLIKALESGDFLLQSKAAEALGRIGGLKAIDALIKAMWNEDSYVYFGVSNALLRIGEPAVPKLVAMLPEEKIGPKAAKLLQEMHWQPSSEREKSVFDIALEKGKSGK